MSVCARGGGGQIGNKKVIVYLEPTSLNRFRLFFSIDVIIFKMLAEALPLLFPVYLPLKKKTPKPQKG